MIFGGNSKHLGSDDRGHGSREIRDDIHFSPCLRPIEQMIGDLLDVPSQNSHTLRRKGHGGQSSQPGVSRGIHKQHLLHHDLGDRIQPG